MPLPDTPVTVQGGCNCGAVRYKIEVPELSKRPVHPALPAGAEKDAKALRFPFACTCHCNDCRTATAGLMHSGICAPADAVWVSAISRNDAQVAEAAGRQYDVPMFDSEKVQVQPNITSREATGSLTDRAADRRGTSERPAYRAGSQMLVPSPESADTFLNFHHSSDRRTRTFCGRCGTSISYNIARLGELAGYFEMLDMSLGTLDREDLEMWEIQAQLWWGYGVGWIKDLSKGSKVPRYEASQPLTEKEIFD